MSMEQMHSPTGAKLEATYSSRTTEREAPDAARKHPWWVALFGAALIILGLIAIGAAVTATLATALIFGILLLVGGATQLVEAFTSRHQTKAVWRIVAGVLYLLVGGLIVVDPVEGAIGLTFVLALLLILEGIYRMLLASQFAGTAASKGWLIFSGIIGILLGALIWAEWPAAGTWVIGLFVGIELIFAGVALLVLSATRGKMASAS